MKKILFIAWVFLLIGCAKWEILAPTNGELTVELLNVEVTFDYNNQQLDRFNKNWVGARVIVSRRANDVWSEYLELVDGYVPGRTEVSDKSYFERGDKIKIWVRLQGDNDKDIWRETYFQLGKRIPASVIFPNEQPEQFELYQNDDGSMTLEFTY